MRKNVTVKQELIDDVKTALVEDVKSKGMLELAKKSYTNKLHIALTMFIENDLEELDSELYKTFVSTRNSDNDFFSEKTIKRALGGGCRASVNLINLFGVYAYRTSWTEKKPDFLENKVVNEVQTNVLLMQNTESTLTVTSEENEAGVKAATQTNFFAFFNKSIIKELWGRVWQFNIFSLGNTQEVGDKE